MRLFLPVAALILFFLCVIFGTACQRSRNQPHPMTEQVGMFSYRNAALTGYRQYNNKGTLKKKIIIKRNKQGTIAEKSHYDAAGVLSLKLIYEYDKAKLHRKIKRSPDGETVRDNLYTYDMNGHLKEQQVFGADSRLMKTHVYVFNHNSERIQKTSFDAKGCLKKNKIYLFDSRGRRYRDYTLSINGDIILATQYIYDDDSNISNIRYSDGYGKLKTQAVITYDHLNRRLKKERFDI